MARTKQSGSGTIEKTDQIMVLHNLQNSDHSIPHPRWRSGERHDGITVPARGYFPLVFVDEEVTMWKRSYELQRSVKAGLIEVLYIGDMSEIPEDYVVTEEFRLNNAQDNLTVDNILYSDDQSMVTDIVKIMPRLRGRNEIDRAYLKDRHVPILRNTLDRANNDSKYQREHAGKREWLVPMLVAQIDRIQDL